MSMKQLVLVSLYHKVFKQYFNSNRPSHKAKMQNLIYILQMLSVSDGDCLDYGFSLVEPNIKGEGVYSISLAVDINDIGNIYMYQPDFHIMKFSDFTEDKLRKLKEIAQNTYGDYSATLKFQLIAIFLMYKTVYKYSERKCLNEVAKNYTKLSNKVENIQILNILKTLQ